MSRIDDGQLQLPPTISIADVSRFEGSFLFPRSFAFDVTLSHASVQDVSVDFGTTPGTADRQQCLYSNPPYCVGDFVQGSGTLTIPAGQTSGRVLVPVVPDKLTEPDETFFVTLSDPNNAFIADGEATGTIRNDD